MESKLLITQLAKINKLMTEDTLGYKSNLDFSLEATLFSLFFANIKRNDLNLSISLWQEIHLIGFYTLQAFERPYVCSRSATLVDGRTE